MSEHSELRSPEQLPSSGSARFTIFGTPVTVEVTGDNHWNVVELHTEIIRRSAEVPVGWSLTDEFVSTTFSEALQRLSPLL